MKIFNLQSKKGLVVWSVVLGIILNHAFRLFVYSDICGPVRSSIFVPDGACSYSEKVGWPIPSYGGGLASFTWHLYILNFIFWALIIYLVLSLIAYFKNKSNNLAPKT